MRDEDAADVLLVKPWHDPVVDAQGLDPHGHRFTALWTPLLGPAATATFRALHVIVIGAASAATECGEPDSKGTVLPVQTLASALGLSARKGPIVLRTALRRLQRHALVARKDTEVAVRTSAPPPTQRQSSRMPVPWQEFLASQSPQPAQAPGKRRPRTPCSAAPGTRQLALRLLQTGHATDEVRRHLRRLGETEDGIESTLSWIAEQHACHGRAGG